MQKKFFGHLLFEAKPDLRTKLPLLGGTLETSNKMCKEKYQEYKE